MDPLKLTMVVLGVGLVAAALGLWFKEGGKWPHLVAIALGATLAGLSNVEMAFGKEGGSIRITRQVADEAGKAIADTQKLLQVQENSLKELRTQIGLIETALKAVDGKVTTQLAAGPAAAPPGSGEAPAVAGSAPTAETALQALDDSKARLDSYMAQSTAIDARLERRQDRLSDIARQGVAANPPARRN